ncbi:hypothetical protein SynMVIR181_02887 [Synechococcus sp. MVIR-18-1]|nr:hypothetical protein SynMVIR181_02887 [Synechococcus sp. MVIR-18-1]
MTADRSDFFLDSAVSVQTRRKHEFELAEEAGDAMKSLIRKEYPSR